MADVEGVAAAVRAELGEGAAADELDPAELVEGERRANHPRQVRPWPHHFAAPTTLTWHSL